MKPLARLAPQRASFTELRVVRAGPCCPLFELLCVQRVDGVGWASVPTRVFEAAKGGVCLRFHRPTCLPLPLRWW